MKAKSIVKGSKRVAGKALEKVETQVMAAVGRKAVKMKVGSAKKAAAKVGRAAVKAGLVAGATAAAAMLLERNRTKRKGG